MSKTAMTEGYFSHTTIEALALKLASREITSVELTHIAFKEIERLNGDLNAFVSVDYDNAIKQAEAADEMLARGHYLGKLHGIPLGIKDNIDTCDLPTTYGSRYFAQHHPSSDAMCVTRLRNAGAVIVGKTLTHEFAFGPTGDRSLQGASKNPHDIKHMTGGSSAGSAAAVAAGMVPAAIGTDTGGSIRIPAAFCGVVGFKPGWGKVSVDGVFPVAESLDHVGVLARTAADAALIYHVLADESHNAPEAVPRTLRTAWVETGETPLDGEIRSALWAFSAQLFNDKIVKIDLAALLNEMRDAFGHIQRAEVSAVHAERLAEPELKFEAEVEERLQLSTEVRGWELISSLKKRDKIKQDMREIFADYDLLLMPTVPVSAPLVDQRKLIVSGKETTTREAVLSMTSPWNLCGLPAITIPAGSLNALPIGLQIIGPEGSEVTLLNIIAALQQ